MGCIVILVDQRKKVYTEYWTESHFKDVLKIGKGPIYREFCKILEIITIDKDDPSSINTRIYKLNVCECEYVLSRTSFVGLKEKEGDDILDDEVKMLDYMYSNPDKFIKVVLYNNDYLSLYTLSSKTYTSNMFDKLKEESRTKFNQLTTHSRYNTILYLIKWKFNDFDFIKVIDIDKVSGMVEDGEDFEKGEITYDMIVKLKKHFTDVEVVI